MNSWSNAVWAGASSADALVNASALAAQNQSVLGVELKRSADEQRALGTASGDAAAQTLDAAAAQEELKAALKGAQEAAASTAVSTSLNAAKEQANEASRAVSFLEAELGKLDARMSDEAAVVKWNRGFQDGIASLNQLKTAGGLNLEALKQWDVAALQVGKSNQELYDTMSKQADAYPELIGQTFAAAGGVNNLEAATKAATDAAGRAHSDFIQMGIAAGLTGDEAEALAAKLGILDSTQISPKLFEVIAQDQAAQQTVADIQAKQIGAKSFDITAGADGAYATADDVLSYVDASGATISVMAQTGAAVGAVNGLVQTTNNTTATTTTKTNTGPADAGLNGWQNQANSTTAVATLNANPNQANSVVNTTVSNVAGRPDAVLSVGANTTPFQGAVTGLIRDVGARSATLAVNANTAPFMAAFNALPTSKTVTITTVNQTVAAPPPAPAGVTRMDTGAGGLGRASAQPVATSSSSGASSSNIVVNVNGALDPDAVARQIRGLLNGRDRRTGGVLVL
jgi:hypothetical protein